MRLWLFKGTIYIYIYLPPHFYVNYDRSLVSQFKAEIHVYKTRLFECLYACSLISLINGIFTILIISWVSTITSFLICFFTFLFGNVYICYIHLIRLCLLSQSSVLHSQPKSTVGTPAYIAPEVLLKKEYDGKVKKLVC